ncbi:hypothetical protein P43SY_003021 [Pythium insidiosum]|uniref:Cationic amino acid transporter C-terminal domain-containing protein n=1 Tax=Pythium insidiosum TaxID=114742 RepID=A0AAD5LJQ2_PYTIN|nr:hypothetical protein P43SY_003021 [Pythium insidiosum]
MSFLTHAFRTKPLAVIRAEENAEDLPRTLSLFDLICIGVGGTVGTGIFATTGEIISTAAGPAAVVSWAVAGTMCILNAFSYMELTTRVPSSGSTYAYAYHTLGELPAVIAAWLLTLEYGMSGAGVARSWAQKMEDWLKDDYPDKDFHYLNAKYANILAALVMALSVAVLLGGVRFGKFFVNTISTIKVVIVFFIIGIGIAIIDVSNLSPFVPDRIEVDGKGRYGTQGVISGASLAFFGYIGFDEVCCLAAEAKNPKKTMPIAVIVVVVITMVLSVLSSFVLAGMTSYDLATDFPAALNIRGYKWAAKIVQIGQTTTMPVVVLIAFLAQPRLNYAMACDGLMPQIFAKVDGKGNLFINTLISGLFFTIVSFVVPFSALWDIVNFGIFFSFVMANASLLVARTRTASPKTAPTAIAIVVASAFISTFSYQLGYVNNDSVVALVFAIIFLVLMVAACIFIAVKCPLEATDPEYYSAPLVPFLPTIAILADFYMLAQTSYLGLKLSLGWVAIAILSYFVYGYRNSAGRTGWSALLSYLPKTNHDESPMLSFNEETEVMEFYRESYAELIELLQGRSECRSDPYAVRRVCHELSRAALQRRNCRLEMVQDAEALDQDSIVELGIVERLLQFMESHRAECDVLLLWHVLKAVEMLCRSSVDRQVDTRRVDLLMLAGAPQFALSIIKAPSVVHTTHVAEQAIRLLEVLATVAVKVIYNSTEHPGVLVLCERAASAIEGT